jgi:hypothetical protein
VRSEGGQDHFRSLGATSVAHQQRQDSRNLPPPPQAAQELLRPEAGAPRLAPRAEQERSTRQTTGTGMTGALQGRPTSRMSALQSRAREQEQEPTAGPSRRLVAVLLVLAFLVCASGAALLLYWLGPLLR